MNKDRKSGVTIVTPQFSNTFIRETGILLSANPPLHNARFYLKAQASS